jgi:hypothetical protein
MNATAAGDDSQNDPAHDCHAQYDGYRGYELACGQDFNSGEFLHPFGEGF